VIGLSTELAIAADLTAAGFVVLFPMSYSAMFDLVILREGAYSKVQVKVGQIRCGSVYFRNLHRRSKDVAGAHRYEPGSFDFWGVYCRENRCSYLVPADLVRGHWGILSLGVGVGKSPLQAGTFKIGG